MTERDIRGLLERATHDRMLVGWIGHGVFGDCDSFTITPAITNEAVTMDREQIEGFCAGLTEIGMSPLYRASEPWAIRPIPQDLEDP